MSLHRKCCCALYRRVRDCDDVLHQVWMTPDDADLYFGVVFFVEGIPFPFYFDFDDPLVAPPGDPDDIYTPADVVATYPDCETATNEDGCIEAGCQWFSFQFLPLQGGTLTISGAGSGKMIHMNGSISAAGTQETAACNPFDPWERVDGIWWADLVGPTFGTVLPSWSLPPVSEDGSEWEYVSDGADTDYHVMQTACCSDGEGGSILADGTYTINNVSGMIAPGTATTTATPTADFWDGLITVTSGVGAVGPVAVLSSNGEYFDNVHMAVIDSGADNGITINVIGLLYVTVCGMVDFSDLVPFANTEGTGLYSIVPMYVWLGEP